MLLVDSKSEPAISSTLAQLKERANHNPPRGPGHHELSWNTLLAAGPKLAAVGPAYASTALSSSASQCQLLSGNPSQDPRWRELASASSKAQLIMVDHSVWDHPDFVQDGLAQLCHALSYRGHFLWTGGPSLWPRRAQTRARILRLCSLHGLRLVRHLKIGAGAGADQPSIRGWLLERRDPVHTLVYG